MSARLKVPIPVTKNYNKQNQGIEAEVQRCNINTQSQLSRGATGKNWNDTYDKIKEFLPRQTSNNIHKKRLMTEQISHASR